MTSCGSLIVFLAALTLLTTTSYGADNGFRFASYYSDHMVLQRALHSDDKGFQSLANVWGYIPEHDNVTLSFTGNGGYTETIVTCRKDNCTWAADLAPYMGPGGPYVVKATSPKYGSISIKDVYFGDVWICSGQSNMVFNLAGAFNASAEIENAGNYPEIRLFTVKPTESTQPQEEPVDILQPWQIASPESVKGPGYFSAVCWLFARKLYDRYKIPLGMVSTAYGGTPIQAWSSPDALRKCPTSKRKKVGGPSTPSVLWNAMIRPFLNMTIFGALWYQGEANSHDADLEMYSCYFPNMIDDWRAKWGQATGGNTRPKFPFGFVQLAAVGADNTTVGGFPSIRWDQTAHYGYVPNPKMDSVFMAVAMDLGDPDSPHGSVHPRDKEDVGTRLVLAGSAIAYGDTSGYYTGPIAVKVIMAELSEPGVHMIVRYTNISNTLNIRSPYGFEVGCISSTGGDPVWLEGLADVQDSAKEVTVHFPHCSVGSTAKMIRYAWRENPCPIKKCSVYSGELPSPPFLLKISENPMP